MKFIADVMLGRLAKRLRLLGFDVLYDRNLDDNAVIRHSLEERRLILTRDLSLTKRPLASRHLFIQSEQVDQQVDEVLSRYAPGGHKPLSRCSQCNSTLAAISKKEAKDVVPRYVFENRENFLQCGSCKRVYWKGSHVRRMKLTRTK